MDHRESRLTDSVDPISCLLTRAEPPTSYCTVRAQLASDCSHPEISTIGSLKNTPAAQPFIGPMVLSTFSIHCPEKPRSSQNLPTFAQTLLDSSQLWKPSFADYTAQIFLLYGVLLSSFLVPLFAIPQCLVFCSHIYRDEIFEE